MVSKGIGVAARAFALAVLLVLTGCGSEGLRRGTLHFGMDDAPEGKRIYFPAGSEVPRYFFAGQLIGEQNFKHDEEPPGFFKWLSNLIVGEDAPRVLQRPQGVAFDEASGRIFVTDISRAMLWVFDPQAGQLLEWTNGIEARPWLAPTGIAVGEQGEVFVADADMGLIAHLDAKGVPQAPIGKGVLTRPNGVAYDRAGKRLFVADTGAHDIKVFDREGRLMQSYGAHGDGPGEFNAPIYLVLHRGDIYVADAHNARVQVLDAETGVARRSIGGRGIFLGQMTRPKGVAVDSEDNVYVVDSMYDHVLVYNSRGEFLLPIGGTGPETTSFYLPGGLAIDSHDRVFVADTFNGRITILQFLGGDYRHE